MYENILEFHTPKMPFKHPYSCNHVGVLLVGLRPVVLSFWVMPVLMVLSHTKCILF